MADRYVVAAGGASNVVGTWSATSGGAGGETVPVSGDTVYCDAASGNLVWTGSQSFDKLICTGYTGTMSGSGTLTILGDTFLLVAGMTYTATGTITFTGANAAGDVTLTRAGKTSSQGYNFNGAGKVFKLADDHNIGTGTWTWTAGTFDAQGFDLWGQLSTSNSNVRAVDLGGSTFTCTSNGGISISTVTNLTWTSPDVLVINLATSPGGTFLSAPLTFPLVQVNLTSTGGDWYGGRISDASLVVQEMQFTGIPSASSLGLFFTVSTNIRIDKCEFPEGVQLVSTARGTQRTITTSTNELTSTGAAFRDIVVSGGPLLAVDSIDLGNNSGITFGNFGANTHEVIGETLDNDGVALPSCDVFLMKRVGDELVQAGYVESDAVTGAYTIGAPDNDAAAYVVVSTKGTPERGDAMGGITPTVP